MSTPTATLTLSNVVFHTLPTFSTATFSLTSSDPTADFSFDNVGNTLTIQAASTTAQVEITFVLDDANHILTGLAFMPDGSAEVGRRAFPDIAVSRSTTCSTLVVTDDYSLNGTVAQTFPFVLLIQRVSDGHVGGIDPGIINNPNEN
ncbi:hypothetical protein [Synoicihabitans lomoniglobus]|uniref:Uncharacterized protein n=1 Tax=Synoicihabitans lomoniglobus TaxID=2909285 RepID=A0AAE9ZX31_9BACT|nr:hypothetical protein [Opitutaceae bacterium LMO-M01]WED64679.1 hypothetical protein PXH66_20235 [Opitutaceae bacterium LMO-M01]